MQCGSVFAPVIQYVVNLVYQLMKAIQSLVYSFSGINIFAKATASSMNKTAGSANKASKSLAGIHGEINNVSENNNSSGSGSASPNIDLSQIDNSMTTWIEKWKIQISKLFEPFKNAWNSQGQNTIDSIKNALNNMKESINSMGKSWLEVWSNGTGQYTIEYILKIFQNIFYTIGEISKAWTNAWDSNNRGTQLVQSMWDAFNKLLELIEVVTGKIKEFASSPIIQEYFANAIEMITNFWNALGGLIEFLTGVFTGDWAKVWNGLKDFVSNIFEMIWNIINEKIILIKVIITNVLTEITNIWSNVWNGIKDFASNIWNGLLDKIDNIFPGMRNIIETNIENIKNIIGEMLNRVGNGWNNIGETVSRVWSGVKTATINIWSQIYNIIKGPINWILEGIEKMANGVVIGINKVIRSLNTLHFTMPDWLGGGTFGINLPTINQVSLPRLAKGNVAYSPLIAQFGEYSGASTNPEITAPQNILKETFDEVLSDHEWNNSDNNSPMQLSVYVGNKKLGEVLLDNLRDIRRQTGQGIEVLVGG